MAKNPVKYCLVDAFTDTAFRGNPAAVCMLSEKKDEEWLQSVTIEFNHPVTCYLTPIVDVDSELKNENPTFRLRWFSPVVEDPVCGSAHCALASYWRKKLGKHDFVAYAASPRSGVIKLHFNEETQRVFLRGKAVIVAEGSLLV